MTFIPNKRQRVLGSYKTGLYKYSKDNGPESIRWKGLQVSQMNQNKTIDFEQEIRSK